MDTYVCFVKKFHQLYIADQSKLTFWLREKIAHTKCIPIKLVMTLLRVMTYYVVVTLVLSLRTK